MRVNKPGFQHQQRPKKNTLIIGIDAVLDAISTGKQVERIYLSNTVYGKAAGPILEAAEKYSIPVNKVPIEKINGFNIGDHDGCVGVKGRVRYQDLQEVISFVVESGKAPLLLFLDGITDIRNIGGIARTAWCCGVDAIVIPEKGVGALNEDAMITSAGALEKISICRVNTLMKAAEILKLNGIKIFASEMTAKESVYSCDFSEPCAIIMGSEDKGIYPALMKYADNSFHIPMVNDFESLNVSVATAMILYEAMKQRLKSN
ncbi:MAG: 23S rRNA (guanosine(2251)-2'-O)-methyltransferase RlmB [Ginsengibacter sp.]